MCALKEHLTGRATAENKQVFVKPPPLQELVSLLRVIVEELVEYRVWSVSPGPCSPTQLAF